MVSTNTSQYIADFHSTPSTADSGKSPLALLAKTCETIGMPETPAKRTPEKKDISPGDVKKSVSPVPKRSHNGRPSPRNTPKTSSGTEPSTSLSGGALPKSVAAGFPLGFPMGFPMGFPGMPGMMAYPPMPFPGFPMGAPFMRCPAAMLGGRCVTPGCTQCTPTSMPSSSDAITMAAAAAATASFPGMPPFPYPFMPSTSAASGLPASYQQMLQQASAVAAASLAASSAPSTPSAPSPTQHSCNWLVESAPCGKKFGSAEELTAHVQAAHMSASSPPTKSPAPVITSTPSTPSMRYHPYAKAQTSSAGAASLAASPMASPFPFAMPFPAALQAMYARGLMPAMPHP